MPPRTRFHSLDGLRGVAAVVVLIHHGLLTFPSLADAYYDLDGRGVVSLPWVLSYTPLHAFWAGAEAVYLFFILSGIVLVLPALRAGSSFSWAAYYPRRLIRLYVPVIAAVALGALLLLLAARFHDPGLGAWMNNRSGGYTQQRVAQDVLLVFGTSGVVSPLWSLRWEVLFSLLLPVFVGVAAWGRRWWWAKLMLVLALMATGTIIGNPFLFYLPMFAIGALLVAEWDRIGATLAALDARPWAWPTFLLVATLLTTSSWTLLGLGAGEPLRNVAGWVPVVGTAMLILAAGFFRPATRALASRPIAWLGRISFSLYLVHEPLVIAARVWTFPLSPWVGLLLSVPAAFAVAVLFTRLVEKPSHVLAKRVGTWATSGTAPVSARHAVR